MSSAKLGVGRTNNCPDMACGSGRRRCEQLGEHANPDSLFVLCHLTATLSPSLPASEHISGYMSQTPSDLACVRDAINPQARRYCASTHHPSKSCHVYVGSDSKLPYVFYRPLTYLSQKLRSDSLNAGYRLVTSAPMGIPTYSGACVASSRFQSRDPEALNVWITLQGTPNQEEQAPNQCGKSRL